MTAPEIPPSHGDVASAPSEAACACPHAHVAHARPRRRGIFSKLFAIAFALIAGVAFGGTCATCLAVAQHEGDEVVGEGRDRIGVIELFGPIADVGDVVRNLREFARRKDLAGIVVRIDSPGGAVGPSQEVYAAMRYASEKKPVVASMGAVAASGGFWASLGADFVLASPGTITGSIGVITQAIDLRGLSDLARVKVRTFKSGPLKDVGNPFRELTEEDEKLYMSLISDIYDQFVSLTAERRKLERSKVLAVADGRIMTGRAALEAGLIDELGGLHDAAKKAVALAADRPVPGRATPNAPASEEAADDPTLVYPKKRVGAWLELLTESTARALAIGVRRGLDEIDRSEASVELR